MPVGAISRHGAAPSDDSRLIQVDGQHCEPNSSPIWVVPGDRVLSITSPNNHANGCSEDGLGVDLLFCRATASVPQKVKRNMEQWSHESSALEEPPGLSRTALESAAMCMTYVCRAPRAEIVLRT